MKQKSIPRSLSALYTRGSQFLISFVDMARSTVVSAMHVLEICDDIGTCWHDLGITLNLPPAILNNIDVEHPRCREKARAMLYEWIRREGSSATIQCLVDALETIEKKGIAQRLLGT